MVDYIREIFSPPLYSDQTNLLIFWELVGAYSHNAWLECVNFTKDVKTQSNECSRNMFNNKLLEFQKIQLIDKLINFNELRQKEVDFEAC